MTVSPAVDPGPGLFEIGRSPKRLEDERLLRGRGRFLDDLPSPQAAFAYVVRSPHPHARLLGLDLDEARAVPGVLCVLIGADLAAAGIGPLHPHALENPHTGEEFRYEPQPVLALDRVRYVGEPVALVVAQSRAQAVDAAERIRIDYEPLPAITTAEEALAPGAVELSARVPGNVCLDWAFGDRDDTERAFGNAAHVVTLTVRNHRIAINAMETRAALGSWDPEARTYRLELSSQNVHVIRDHIARSLGVACAAVHVTAPDVGGGFGVRNFVYAEYVLVLWAARECGRPVKWVSTRSDSFVSDHQARDFDARAELALDADGRFLALRVRSWANVGGYMVGAACGVQTGQYTTLPGTVYDFSAVHLEIGAVLTNAVPIGVTRGPGFAESVDLLERLIDKAARQIGCDRFDLRRRNLIEAPRMPWTNCVGNVVDSGDFSACLERALRHAEISRFPQRTAASRAEGKLRGVGIAYHIKATGGLPEENVALAFEDDAVTITTGTQAIGQGHETTFRQIAGSLLGLGPEQVNYRAGDTRAIAMGGGHGSSRATYMAGTALSMAAAAAIEKGRPLAARALEAVAVEEVEFSNGLYRVPGSNRTIGLLDVARRAAEAGQPLDTYRHFVRDAMTYPNGCHVAEVEIDPETGQVRLERYTAVDDYGVLVNPMIAAGQVHGAIAQGVGQALMEAVRHDPESAQPLTGTFMDYCLPRADDMPAFDLTFSSTRCTTNPLGVKGCGEAGAIAGFPAVANAIIDALAPYGVTQLEGPATPFRIWELLRAGRGDEPG